MNLSTLARRGLVGCAATAAVLTATVAPAAANDHTAELVRNGQVLVRATWDDSIDTLCVRVLAGSSSAEGIVGISSAQGLPEPDRATRTASTTRSQGRYCTENLSIREDALYDMQLQFRDRVSGAIVLYNSRITQFYT